MKRFKPVEVQRLLSDLNANKVQAQTKLVHLRGGDKLLLFVRTDQSLLCYRYDEKAKIWQYIWSEAEIFTESDEIKYTPWLVSDDGFVTLRTGTGIHIYRLDDELKLIRLSSDGRYHDTYGWNQHDHVLLLDCFYSDPKTIGIMSRDDKGIISFEAVNKDAAQKYSQQPIVQMESDPQVPAPWRSLTTDIWLARVDSTDQQAFVVRTDDELGIYKFGKRHVMEKILTTRAIPHTRMEGERTIFGRFFSSIRQVYDVVHFNETGMTAYEYVPSIRDFNPLIYASQFAKDLGWTPDHAHTVTLYDLDHDRIDELVFNGPSGLNAVRVTTDSRNAVNILSESFNVSDRYARSIAVIDAYGKQKVVSVGERGVISFKLELDTADTDEQLDTIQYEFKHEDAVNSIPLLPVSLTFLSVLPLHDQLDIKSFLYPRNPLLGTLDFSVPLIEVPNAFGIPISHSIQFKEYNPAGVMGSGWSFPMDCIYIERSGSIFSIDHNYYLVKDGAQSQLQPKFEKHETGYISFTLDGSPDVDIKLYKTLNKWEVKTKDELFSYGSLNNVDWIQWEPGSDEWPVTFNTTVPTKAKPSVWFLAMRKDNHGHYLKYIYDPEYSKLASGKPYVVRLNLLKIISSSGDSVRFGYSNVHNTTLFSGFTVQTSSYTQDVKLQYSSFKSVPHLVSINQLGAPVLQFTYEGPRREMTEIHYPNGLISKFSYSFVTFPSAMLANKFNSLSNIQVTYGANYMIVSGTTESNQVRVMARDVVGSDTTQMSGLTFPILGKEPVVSFEVLTAYNFFLVVLSHKTHKEICVFRQKSQGWSSDASYMKLAKESIVEVGKSFVLLRSAGKLAILQLIADKWDAKPVLNKLADDAIVHAFSWAYVVYNDLELSVGFQDDDGTWNKKPIPIGANLIKGSLLVFDKFDTDTKTIDALKKGFMEGVVHIQHNGIIIRTLSMQGQKLYLNLHFKMFGHKYELTHQETLAVLVENLDEYLLELPPIGGNYFKIGYTYVNGKYQVIVKGHTGTIIDEINSLKEKVEEQIRSQPNIPEAEKIKYRQESHDKLNGELQKIYKNVTAGIPFAIDPSKFGVYINDDHVIAASHKIRFDGDRWNNVKIADAEINIANFRMNLGESFLLTKNEKTDTFKLYNSNIAKTLLWDLDTLQGNDIFLSYPAFIGVQKSNETGKIFTFENKKLHHLPDREIIIRTSNRMAVITVSEDRKSATVRSVKSFTNYRQSVITRQELIHGDQDKRTTTFEYDSARVKPFANGFAFTKSKVLPGGKPEMYGFYEENFNLAAATNSSKTVHNAMGIIVKTLEADPDTKPDQFDSDTILTDRRKRHQIVDFRPFKISQEVVSYYGFEPYELNRIGTYSRWVFSEQLIVNENSNHFLRMNNGSSIFGRFHPKLEGMSFLVSCWIRTPQSALISKNFIIKVLSIGGQLLTQVEGKIKLQIGDWYYVEATHQVGNAEHNQIQLEIQITNSGSSYFDVDHLRLTPFDFNFQANIFDVNSGKVRAILKNSGLIQQTILDPFGNVCGRISERGTVDLYALKSRNSRAQRNGSLISRVEMKPMLGEIERGLAELKGNDNLRKLLKYSPNILSLRFLYKFTGDGSIVAVCSQLTVRMSRSANHTNIKIGNDEPITTDSEGELTILLTKKFVVVWVQGHLIYERQLNSSAKTWTTIDLKTSGLASLSEIIFLYDPMVKVFYLNKLGLAIQEIILKDHSTVNIRQIVYDGIDRPVMKTKWTVLEASDNRFLNYASGLVTNLNNVLVSRKAEGLVHQLNLACEGYPYTWISYRDEPSEAKTAMGLPGKAFSVDGSYSSRFGTNPNYSFIKNVFPVDKGFKQEYELNSGGALTITVYDQRKNKVAILVKVANHDHRLITYEYDHLNRLLCELPPMYHQKANTFSKVDSFIAQNLSLEELRLRNQWAKQYRYDSEGRLVEKLSPDSGKQEFVYSDEGLLRFVIQSDRDSNSPYDVTFHSYGLDGKLILKGIVDIPRNELRNYLQNNATLPKSENYVMFNYGENELVPSLRHRMQKSMKNSNGVTTTEVLLLDEKHNLLSQIFVSSNSSLSIDYKYNNGKVTDVYYPFVSYGKQLKISYDYNANGKIKSVRMGKRVFVSIEYTPLESIKEMQFEPQSMFSYKRAFTYNEPGFLSSIKDAFLTETIDYISGSYGGRPLGDGTVSANTFNATWHDRSVVGLIKLNPNQFVSNDTSIEQGNLCFEALKRQGFLDNLNRPIRSFYPALELHLPLTCNTGSRANHISKIMTSKGFPLVYGHRYDYENHKQLIKAKYFQNSNEAALEPLTQLTFSKNIRGINATESNMIWNSLKTAGFIITDCSNSKACHALAGKSLFHPVISKHINGASLEILFSSAIKARKDLSEQMFLAVCKVWHQHDRISTTTICAEVWKELKSNSLVGSRSDKSTKALNPEIKEALKIHPRYLGDIVVLLYDHFAKALGNSGGDVQSYDIDANGNHVHFYTGFKRYRMEYLENTNKIAKVFCTDLKSEGMQEVEFSMDHDSEGSVTKATHKGIQRIVYDPLIKRAKAIKMMDGRKLTFHYNIRGERIFKQVKAKNGAILKEKYYVRDIKGRCVIDYELTYLQTGNDPHVRGTSYIYSEDTLIGFIRNDQFYSVYTDHEGSVRLVIKNGEVVAAYDYYPYGQLLREYKSDPEGYIAYRYTGQEWDPETELYNFHARLYDPEIGRFYQIDPKEQYPSPYVYAGNSPISVVDPDGQFAFLIPIAFAAAGAYLGASAANNSFNPFKWELKPTLIGGVMGGVLGALAPAGITGSLGFLTINVGLSSAAAGAVIVTTAVGFAYVSGSYANNNWNPVEWNWSSPGTWNALFSGSLTGATVFAGFGKVLAKYISISGTARITFVVVVGSSTAGLALLSGAMDNDWNFKFWEWDWTNPTTVWRVTSGASFGMSVSADMHNILTQATNKVKDMKGLIAPLKAGNGEQFVSEVKHHFKDVVILLYDIKTTFSVMAIQLRRHPNGLPQVIATGSKKGVSHADGLIGTVQSVLFEISKFEPFQLIAGELYDDFEDLKKLTRPDESRRKRDIQCCELQVSNQVSQQYQSKLIASTASLHISLFGNIFKAVYAQFKFLFDGPNFDDVFTDLGHPSLTKKIRNKFKLQNCYHFEKPDKPATVQCFGLDSQYTIFSKMDTYTQITEDFYSHCTPIEFAGRPSVACDGDESSLLFTPKLSGNTLDHLNGLLMLALVAPAIVENIKDGIKSLFSMISKNPEKVPKPSERDVVELQKKLHNLGQNIEMANSQPAVHLDWIHSIWEDLNDDMRCFLKDPLFENFNDLLDRVEVLESELSETVELICLYGNYEHMVPMDALSSVRLDLSVAGFDIVHNEPDIENSSLIISNNFLLNPFTATEQLQ